MSGGVALVAFTAQGAKLCARLAGVLDGTGWAPASHGQSLGLKTLEGSVGEWAAERFASCEALVFVCAAGIAVRAVGPLLRSKDSDPAVVCVDEAGQYAIPLASGHLGGANDLARRIAAFTGGQAVITTATDLRGIFSPDQWAARNRCRVADKDCIKTVSAALLAGETVGWQSDFPVEGPLPPGLENGQGFRCGIVVSLEERRLFAHTLWLIPRCIVVGVGCRRGIDPGVLEDAVLAALEGLGLPVLCLSHIASIDLKAKEKALLAFSEKYRVPLRTHSPEDLNKVPGDFSASEFVRGVTGVDNVCERAALVEGGSLLMKKCAGQGVTVAVARLEWSGCF